MTVTGKAIETKYQGYRFRSRTEARWAVYFDCLGIKWEYEKEGFQLPSGWYLPDFYFPEWGIWVEVKPRDEHELKAARKKCREFRDTVYQAILLVSGVPEVESYELFCYDTTDSAGGSSDWNNTWFGLKRDGPHYRPVLMIDPCRSDRSLYADSGMTKQILFAHLFDDNQASPALTEDAIEASKSARFEHGDMPVIGRVM